MPEQGLLLVVGCWLLVLFLYHRRSVCIYVNTFFAPPQMHHDRAALPWLDALNTLTRIRVVANRVWANKRLVRVSSAFKMRRGVVTHDRKN